MTHNPRKSRIVTAIVFLLCTFVNATIVSVVPDSAGQGEQLIVSITGQGSQFCIQQGSQTINNVAAVFFQQGSSTITATNFLASDATHLGAEFDIANDASLGLYDVTVEQNSGGNHTLSEGFTITLPDTTSKVVAHWTFNEGSGDSIHDISRYSNHGKVESATWSTGINSGALEFDGIDDSIHIPHSASLASPVEGITMEAWIYAYSFNADYNHIVNKFGNYCISVYQYRPAIAIRADGALWWAPDTDTVPANEWIHYVATYNGQHRRIFINGTMVAEEGLTGLIDESIVGDFEIAGAFNGRIDDACIFSNALSAAEIEERYYSFIGPRPELIAVPSPTFNRRPVFLWRTYLGASSYNIQIDTTTNFQSPIVSIGVSDTTFTPLSDLPINMIYWRVGAGQPMMIYSTTGSFVIQDSLTPMLILYEPNPTLEKRPTLKWHEVTGASTYHLMVDNDISFATPEISLSVGDTSFAPLSDLPTGWIYWKVKSDLNEEYSAASSFIIQSDTIPFLYRFKGTAVNEKRPAFKWKPVTGATSYKIVIDTTSGFTAPVVTIELSDTTFTPLADLEYRLYYWHVSCSRNMALYSPMDSIILTDQVEIENQHILPTVQVLRVFPNPFRGEITINFGKPLNNGDFLSIYSIDGKLVKQFSFKDNAGKTSITWDGRNRNGRTVGNGIYVIKLKSGDKILNKKLISIK